MKNKKIIIVSICFVFILTLFTLVVPSNKIYAADEKKEIIFNDEGLFWCVVDQLSTFDYDEEKLSVNLTETEIDKVTSLSLFRISSSRPELSGDLTGLEAFKNLEAIDAGYARNISDLTVIGKLSNLKKLVLADNNITDITPLKNLVNLEELDLSNGKYGYIGNKIINIDALSELTKLTNIKLQENEIVDISPLKKLTNLTYLDLCDNQINDVTALTSHTNLEELYLDGNKISDITSLKGMVNLVRLSLSLNDISNIEALSGLSKLERLTMGFNKINDLTPLKDLTSLTFLSLSDNQITDISPLKNLVNLTYLDLSDNQINDITALKDLVNIVELDLAKNKITEITSLSNITALETLDLQINNINNIDALSNLTNLKSLNIEVNDINNIDALKGLSNLENIDLSSNHISDITPIKDRLFEEWNYNYLTVDFRSNIINEQIGINQKVYELPTLFTWDIITNYECTNCRLSSDGKLIIINDGLKVGDIVSIEITGQSSDGHLVKGSQINLTLISDSNNDTDIPSSSNKEEDNIIDEVNNETNKEVINSETLSDNPKTGTSIILVSIVLILASVIYICTIYKKHRIN